MAPFSLRSLVPVLLAAGAVNGAAPLSDSADAKQVRQVAIIGAGAAGSSAAYHLRTYAEETGTAVNITVFEKTGRIGGRTLTINPYGNESVRVELGASIFIKDNRILYDRLDEFGLAPRDPDLNSDPNLGIWDGDEFVFQVNEDDSYWWNAYKVIMKYGFLAPRRTQNLMRATIDKFLKLYEAPYFPFRSLTQRTYELDLVEVTGVTGQQLLKANNIGDAYAHDIIQASTRVNYGSNLFEIHGLDTMVSMAPEGAMAVDGGNWQIFHKMVERSGAGLLLNTSVVAISRASREGGDERRYSIRAKSGDTEEDYAVQFHDVVLANPYQFSKISAGDVLESAIDEIPYVRLHVTIFASPFRYSPAFFGLKDAGDVPGTVLTTLSKGEDVPAGVEGSGKAGFFSISTLRKVFNPKTEKEEYLYKIFSPQEVTPEFLSRLFGVEVPDDFVGKPKGSTSDISPISWYYPHVFWSYPKAWPRVTFQDPIVGPGVYYTSGMESFISTMETNALMGKNVARLIIDDILGVSTGSDSESPAHKITCDRGKMANPQIESLLPLNSESLAEMSKHHGFKARTLAIGYRNKGYEASPLSPLIFTEKEQTEKILLESLQHFTVTEGSATPKIVLVIWGSHHEFRAMACLFPGRANMVSHWVDLVDIVRELTSSKLTFSAPSLRDTMLSLGFTGWHLQTRCGGHSAGMDAVRTLGTLFRLLSWPTGEKFIVLLYRKQGKIFWERRPRPHEEFPFIVRTNRSQGSSLTALPSVAVCPKAKNMKPRTHAWVCFGSQKVMQHFVEEWDGRRIDDKTLRVNIVPLDDKFYQKTENLVNWRWNDV
ncbi:hypothetical protein OQA88_8450 [Cercophora sp. LCS_1]